MPEQYVIHDENGRAIGELREDPEYAGKAASAFTVLGFVALVLALVLAICIPIGYASLVSYWIDAWKRFGRPVVLISCGVMAASLGMVVPPYDPLYVLLPFVVFPYAVTLFDIFRKDVSVEGGRWMWFALVFVFSFLGIIAYWLVARRPVPDTWYIRKLAGRQQVPSAPSW